MKKHEVEGKNGVGKHEENAWKRDNRKKWSVEMWSVG